MSFVSCWPRWFPAHHCMMQSEWRLLTLIFKNSSVDASLCITCLMSNTSNIFFPEAIFFLFFSPELLTFDERNVPYRMQQYTIYCQLNIHRQRVFPLRLGLYLLTALLFYFLCQPWLYSIWIIRRAFLKSLVELSSCVYHGGLLAPALCLSFTFVDKFEMHPTSFFNTRERESGSVYR
jgi:hypothetical protein